MVNSLLTAIVRADGDALVMHVGERPYVVASSGPVELSSRPLTLEAVAGMLGQLLPNDANRALDELGAIEHELPQSAAGHGDRFTVVAARGGDDIWIEVRRHRRLRPAPPVPAPAAVPPPAEAVTVPAAAPALAVPAPPVPVQPVVAPQAPVAVVAPVALVLPAVAEPVVVAPPVTEAPIVESAVAESPVDVASASAVPEPAVPATPASALPERTVPELTFAESPVLEPPVLEAPVSEVPVSEQPLFAEPVSAAPELVTEPPAIPVAAVAPPEPLFAAPAASAPVVAVAAAPPAVVQAAPPAPAVVPTPAPVAARPAAPERMVVPAPFVGRPEPALQEPKPAKSPTRVGETRPQEFKQEEPIVRPLVAAPIVERTLSDFAFDTPALPHTPATGTPAAASRPSAVPPPAADGAPAVVLPLARNPIRMESQTRSLPSPRIAGIDRLLRLAAARGANTLYLMSRARPSVRVDGEIAVLEGESVLSAHEVESLLLDLAPERTREALEAGEGTEWMSEVPEVGRIRCQSFRDHRGPGGIFRMISARPTTAEQLGLAREIQALCAEPEGLVLVAGPRASGKSTLVCALVDLINRTRNDYVITIESQIKFAHESRGCLISQREVRGGNEDLAVVVRAALRENPDVLVIEDMRSPEVVRLALEAMESGHLVIGAVSAHGAATAIGRMLDQAPEERRTQMQLALAEGLRGVVSQVLLRKTTGGRVAAREVLLNLPSIANLIAEGRISQLPLAIDSGRKHGMVPLNDALAAFVQNGVVDVKEAYRKAFERQAFLSVLRREGVDTSFVERLA